MNKKIAITGASGLIGKSLTSTLEAKGYQVIAISRSKKPNTRQWSIVNQTAEEEIFEDIDVIIHLSGEGIANKRWSDSQKKKIMNSRVKSTSLLCSLIEKTKNKPSLLICASGIGIYGDQKDTFLNENSPLQGDSFLKEVCVRWEDEASKAKKLGLRVVSTRLGMVLSPKGGALKKMLLPFKLGLGGQIGNGKQFISWISLEDACNAFVHCIENESIKDAVNFCSQNPVANKIFSKNLANALSRPCIFPLPKLIVRLIFGQMGEELLLSSARAKSKKLEETNFIFSNSELEKTFSEIL